MPLPAISVWGNKWGNNTAYSGVKSGLSSPGNRTEHCASRKAGGSAEISREIWEVGGALVEALDHGSPSIAASTYHELAKSVCLAMRRLEPPRERQKR